MSITLSELIISVKEHNLSKDQLENYRDQLSNLYAEMNIEMADLEKEGQSGKFLSCKLQDVYVDHTDRTKTRKRCAIVTGKQIGRAHV